MKKTIIVLGTELKRFKKRFLGGISLYLDDPENSTLLITGRDYTKDKKIKQFVDRICQHYNIPLEKLKIETSSTTTQENALYARKLVKTPYVDIVTSSIHVARAKRYFKREFPYHELKFYAVSEGISTLFKYIPYEILGFAISFLPDSFQYSLLKKLRRLRGF